MSKEWKMKLSKALGLIADVQIEMAQEDERRPEKEQTEDWRELYKIRSELARFLDKLQREGSHD